MAGALLGGDIQGREFELQRTVRASMWEGKEERRATWTIASNQVLDFFGVSGPYQAKTVSCGAIFRKV